MLSSLLSGSKAADILAFYGQIFSRACRWQKSMDLATQVYQCTESFPTREQFGLVSQLRRSAVSISSNIAEGSARASHRDFKHFVLIARGSNCEMQTQIELALRLKMGDADQLNAIIELSHEVGRMLSGLADYLKSSTAKETEN